MEPGFSILVLLQNHRNCSLGIYCLQVTLKRLDLVLSNEFPQGKKNFRAISELNLVPLQPLGKSLPVASN